MIPSRRPQLLELVAVLRSLPRVDVEVGDVGTVVELLSPDGLEVEFLDRDGRIWSDSVPRHHVYRGRVDAQPQTQVDWLSYVGQCELRLALRVS